MLSCGHNVAKIDAKHPLAGKTVYVPAMAEGSVEAFSSVFRWLGIDAYPTPPSDERTRELGAKFTNGDECYPAKVTVGDFVRIMEQPGFEPKRTAFFMAASLSTKTRRKLTPSRPTATCCCPTTRKSTPSRSWKSTPMT